MLSWAQETAKKTGRELKIVDPKEELRGTRKLKSISKE